MRTKRRFSVLEHTVKKFVSREEQQWQRYMRSQKNGTDKTRREKREKQSSFVRFMNRLETCGYQGIGSLHLKWTKAIRDILERDGIWPSGLIDWDISVLARYLQELQRQFWNSLPPLAKQKLLRKNCTSYPYSIIDDVENIYKSLKVNPEDLTDTLTLVRSAMYTFRHIQTVIRDKGLRSRKFIVSRGSRCVRFTRIYIDEYPTDNYVRTRVWFEEGCTLVSYDDNYQIKPILIMPHELKRVNVHYESPERDGKVPQHVKVNVF